MDGDQDTCSVTPRTPELRWWQVKLSSPELIQAVSVTIKSDNKQHFSIFVIEILDGSNALYKPCSEFEGVLREPRVMFDCNEGKGHFGDFVYIRDDRKNHEHFGLCEVEVIPFTATDLDVIECKVSSCLTMQQLCVTCSPRTLCLLFTATLCWLTTGARTGLALWPRSSVTPAMCCMGTRTVSAGTRARGRVWVGRHVQAGPRVSWSRVLIPRMLTTPTWSCSMTP